MFSKRLPIAKLTIAIVVLSAIICAIMLPINWDGEQASTAAPKIDNLLDILIVLSAIVFSAVVVPLAYALGNSRENRGEEAEGEPIHGNTRLEITWTIVPLIIVL